jgi:thymidylate synthase
LEQYLQFLRDILAHGVRKQDRTGTGTISLFSYEMRFNLSAGFPLMTTKRIHNKSWIHELLWFLSGDTNIRYLNDHGVTIWDEWADPQGELGPVYGRQWRCWSCKDGRVIDQMSELVSQIRHHPDSRRLIVSAWNVGEIDQMALPPCHLLFQFYVANGKLSCKLTQRSADAFLGVPFNIASYSLLTHLIAQQCDLAVGEFIWSGGDCHIYLNHLDQVHEQLQRTPGALPTLEILHKADSLFTYRYEDIVFRHYNPQPKIPAPIAV